MGSIIDFFTAAAGAGAGAEVMLCILGGLWGSCNNNNDDNDNNF